MTKQNKTTTTRWTGICLATLALAGCSGTAATGPKSKTMQSDPGAKTHKAETKSFGQDLAFLKQHTGVVLLSDESGAAQVIVAPEYQGDAVLSFPLPPVLGASPLISDEL